MERQILWFWSREIPWNPYLVLSCGFVILRVGLLSETCIVSGQVDGQEVTAAAVLAPRPARPPVRRSPIRRSPMRRPPPRWRASPPRYRGRRR